MLCYNIFCVRKTLWFAKLVRLINLCLYWFLIGNLEQKNFLWRSCSFSAHIKFWHCGCYRTIILQILFEGVWFKYFSSNGRIKKCGWCLAGGRGCWLKGVDQVPDISWLFITHYTPCLLDHLKCTRNAFSIVLLLQMMGGWDRWGVVDLY